MKRAKQILSFMMALSMLFGMMVFTTGTASAATAKKNVTDYVDAEGIEYVEAVDVLTALGVFTGDENNTFGPQGTFTREQAAKIITYLMIGTTAADRLTHQPSSFTDVAQDRWSNPYIEYCAARGIILGRGDGTFAPADPVTASQMAKMLLFTIGYGARDEYTGERWELNTIVDAQRRGILTLDEDFTQPATRDQVAQYTFNTLTGSDAFMVTYSELAQEYLPLGANVWATSVSKSSLGEETFGLVDDVSDRDALGYSVRIWRLGRTSNAQAITGPYRADVTLARSVDGTEIIGTDANMTKGVGLTDLGSYTFKAQLKTYSLQKANGDWEEQPLQVFVNGVHQASYTQTQLSDGTFAASTYNAMSYKRGIIVDLVDRDFDGHADKIVFIEKTIGVVTSNPTVNAFGTTTLNGVRNATGGYTFTAGKVVYPDDLRAGDVVLYYRDNDKTGAVTHVEKADSVSGVLQSHTPNTFVPKYASINLSGSTYYPTGLLGTLADPYEPFVDYVRNQNYFNYGAIGYVDDSGAVVAMTPEDEGEYDFLLLYDMETGSNFSTRAAAIFPDASYKVIDIASLTVGTNVYVSGNVIRNNVTVGNIYSYSLNADGSYALRAETNSSLGSTNTITQKASFSPGHGDSLVGDASTVFVVKVTDTATGNVTFRRYVGVSNAPVFDGTSSLIGSGSVVSKSGIARFVYIDGTPATLQTNTLMFYSISGMTSVKVDNEMRYIYNVVDVDGSETVTKQVTLTQNAHNVINGYYWANVFAYDAVLASVSYSADGIVTSASIPGYLGAPANSSMFRHVGIAANASNGVAQFGGGSYRYNNSTKVYILTGDMFVPVIAGSIQDVVTDPNSIVFGRVATGTTATDLITELYIKRRTEPSIVPATGVTELTGTTGVTKLSDFLAGTHVTIFYDNANTVNKTLSELTVNWTLSDHQTTVNAPILDSNGALQTGIYYFTAASGFSTVGYYKLTVS